MNLNEQKQFVGMLKDAFELYGKTLSTSAIKLWCDCFEKHSLDVLSSALQAHITCPERGQFQPKPADIIAKIQGTDDDRKADAAVVFAQVMDGINVYNSAVFDNAAVHHAVMIAFGSWTNVGLYQEDVFKCQQQKRDFITAFATFKPGMPYAPRLVGIFEQNEASEKEKCFYSIDYFGDKSKALAVEEGGRVGGMNAVNADRVLGLSVIS